MRASWVTFAAVGGGVLVVSAWALGSRLRHSSPPASSSHVAPSLGVPAHGEPAVWPSPEFSPDVAVDRFGQPYWRDPSVDPRVLERAFAPPPPMSSLPPEARPTTPAIDPPEREWRRVQRKDHAVAY
mgnify:CR=1 FL=1